MSALQILREIITFAHEKLTGVTLEYERLYIDPKRRHGQYNAAL